MEIVIGSQNQTKLKAVQNVFQHSRIIPKEVPSNVSAQPIGDEETREGAINRANYAQQYLTESVGIGLEGGVMYVEGKLYLCNWGALKSVDKSLYTAAGARIELPESFKDPLKKSWELSDIMNHFTKKQNVRNHEGAIGIFTDDFVNRAAMFEHVVTLLKGQYSYGTKKGS